MIIRKIRDIIIGFRFKKYGHKRSRLDYYEFEIVKMFLNFGLSYIRACKYEKDLMQLQTDLASFNNEMSGLHNIPWRPILTSSII